MEHDNENFQDALERIRQEFGLEIFRDSRRVFAILRDFAPGMEAESNVIRQLSKRGLLAELESLSAGLDASRSNGGASISGGASRSNGAFPSRDASRSNGAFPSGDASRSNGAFPSGGASRSNGAFPSRDASRSNGAFPSRDASRSNGAFSSGGASRSADASLSGDADDARRERVMMKLRACLTDYLQLSDERAEYYVALLLNLYELPYSVEPGTASTAAGYTGPLRWALDAGGLLTITGGGPMENYAFADEAVNTPWWGRRAEILSVRIRDGVTTVGDSAFYGCSNLESVRLPDSVTRIGEWAFADCAKLDAIALPDSVRRINRGAFSDCKALAEIDLPANLSVIESWTFCNCVRLRRVSIPDNVSSIGQRAFQGCTLLSYLQIPARAWADNAAFEASTNVTRRVQPVSDTQTAAPLPKPRWKPVDIPAWLNGVTYQKFLLFLFALVVILRHGPLTLLLLLAPVGLFLFLERP